MDKDNIQEGKVAELLKVRYKVIADYPFNPKDVGEIEEPFDEQSESFLKEYPHLFKKLEWWQDREENDMPEYVKTDGEVYKVDHYSIEEGHLYAIFTCGATLGGAALRAQVFPSSKEEFHNQNK